ncbi:class I SAM-dependent methyltransferase [Paraburkholderia sp. WC7.3d]|uniref:class I SAM-dependent methyltransferase n=1 Tax=Paraburkholderia sp. WC7.3d TaxID=2991069 RepID=UPI003D1DD5CD
MKGTELDLYATDEPGHALAFNLFNGTWVSDVPGYGLGMAPHFDDGRLHWFETVCGGFSGKSVLELGPMEGGHTFMMAKAGASRVLAIEANSKSFLKCLLVQNALKFNAEFMYGDFRELLKKRDQRFDLILASGVLYHMIDPVSLLENMAHASDSICIWTHYYDAEVARTNTNMQSHVDPTPTISEFRGREVHTPSIPISRQHQPREIHRRDCAASQLVEPREPDGRARRTRNDGDCRTGRSRTPSGRPVDSSLCCSHSAFR